MPDALDPGPLGNVEKRLPILGRAMAEALARLSPQDPQRFTFCLFVFDPESRTILHTSNHEEAGLYASLSQFLQKHTQ